MQIVDTFCFSCKDIIPHVRLTSEYMVAVEEEGKTTMHVLHMLMTACTACTVTVSTAYYTQAGK